MTPPAPHSPLCAVCTDLKQEVNISLQDPSTDEVTPPAPHSPLCAVCTDLKQEVNVSLQDPSTDEVTPPAPHSPLCAVCTDLKQEVNVSLQDPSTDEVTPPVSTDLKQEVNVSLQDPSTDQVMPFHPPNILLCSAILFQGHIKNKKLMHNTHKHTILSCIDYRSETKRNVLLDHLLTRSLSNDLT